MKKQNFQIKKEQIIKKKYSATQMEKSKNKYEKFIKPKKGKRKKKTILQKLRELK